MTEYEETPRTDKAAFTSTFGGPVVVDVDFAQELEIELAEAKAELRKLRERCNGAEIGSQWYLRIPKCDKNA